jgi:hypothetical protein
MIVKKIGQFPSLADIANDEAPLRPGPANRLDHAAGRGFGLWGQRFLARDHRTACERRLQTDRAGAASGVGEARVLGPD